MQVIAVAGALAASGCSEQVSGAGVADSSVECALAGAGNFTAECTMERMQVEAEQILILRHPDGGFRRFNLGVPGRGLVTADGLEQAQVEQLDGMIEVRVGSDKYRLPVRD